MLCSHETLKLNAVMKHTKSAKRTFFPKRSQHVSVPELCYVWYSFLQV